MENIFPLHKTENTRCTKEKLHTFTEYERVVVVQGASLPFIWEPIT